MTPITLLEELEKFIKEKTKDIILQVKVNSKNGSDEPKERAANIHKMKLPSKDAETKQIPYILLQFLTGKDTQEEGRYSESECQIRIVVATYSEDGSEGALDVLNILTRIRNSLLKEGIIAKQFLIKKPLEYIVYPEDTAPYYLGEMITIWSIPSVEREALI